MKKATVATQWLGVLEARAGVEPTYTDLQRIHVKIYLYKSIGCINIS
jgi:hypothetical protein